MKLIRKSSGWVFVLLSLVLNFPLGVYADTGEEILKSILDDENAPRTVKRRAEELLNHNKNEVNHLLKLQLDAITRHLKTKGESSQELIDTVLQAYDKPP